MQHTKVKRGRPRGRPRRTRRGPLPRGHAGVVRLILEVGCPEATASNQAPEEQGSTQNTTEPMTFVNENVPTRSSAERISHESTENELACIHATPTVLSSCVTRRGLGGRPRGNKKCLTIQEEDRRIRERRMQEMERRRLKGEKQNVL